MAKIFLLRILKYSNKKEYALKKNVILKIGSSQECDIILHHPKIADEHAEIFFENGFFFVRNLIKKGGLTVNGTALGKNKKRPLDQNRMHLDFFGVKATFLIKENLGSTIDGDIEGALTLPPVIGKEEKSGWPNLLYDVSDAIRLELEMEMVIDKIIFALQKQFPGSRCYLGLCSKDDEAMTWYPDERKQFSGTIVAATIKSGQAHVIQDIDKEITYIREAESILADSIKSIICIPILTEGTVSGIIYADNRFSRDAYINTDFAYLTALGALLGSVFKFSSDATKLKAEARNCIQIQNCGPFIGKSEKMQEVFDKIKKYASMDESVLITGETGTGKELVARYLHFGSTRNKNNFVPVQLSAESSALLESELFGHKKGAFTGAISEKEGYIQLADNGTLFLDEISETDLDLQTKLLRFLQEKEFSKVGENKLTKVNTRIICATNRPLEKLIHEGDFREDLFYRVDELRIELVPLRERSEDIPLLLEYFIGLKGGSASNLSAKARQKLIGYHWPGNVRQLQNVIGEALINSGGKRILPEHITFRGVRNKNISEWDWMVLEMKYHEALDKLDEKFILEALRKTGNKIKPAAIIMNISENNFRSKIRKLKITYD